MVAFAEGVCPPDTIAAGFERPGNSSGDRVVSGDLTAPAPNQSLAGVEPG